MQCPGCSVGVAEGRKFCGKCGTALPCPCPRCGQAVPYEDSFCSQCGASVVAGGITPATHRPAPATGPAVERRQLTIMFCDMVGSSALSTRLDPEEQGDVIAAFHACCGNEIKSLGGMVAQYLGDGLLAYFGYPTAHENDAERAILAGLGILKAVASLKPAADVVVQTRIAIGSGVVVVGDLVRQSVTQENAAIGETTNLVARLQAIAEPDSIVISPITHRLAGALFDYRDLGRHSLKGFSKPVHVHQVLRVSKVESRFEAQHQSGTSPLLGREEELDLLSRRWEEARRGEGRVVLLTGEPGIGKSRIVRALRDRMTSDPHTALSYFCSPHHQGSALYPSIIQLTRAAGIERDDSAEAKLDKLQSLLAQSSGNLTEDMPLFAALLSIPGDDRYPLREMNPQRRKERTFVALLDQIKRLAARRPILAVYEDLHWIDPTSLELLSLAIEQITDQRIMLVATARSEFTPPWPGHRNVAMLALTRLGRSDGEALIASISKGKPLPPEVRDQIIARTDGVPLFIEELTKTVLESGLLREADDHFELTVPFSVQFASAVDSIPSTLRGSLAARLDRLKIAKPLAQVAATLGRVFDGQVLSAVTGESPAVLREQLVELVRDDFLQQDGIPANARYSFRHALIQDAAYDSLLKSERQSLHCKIADVLASQFPATVAATPEVLAQHYAAANLIEPAVLHWEAAGKKAAERSANVEAATHFANALVTLRRLPDSTERARRELSLEVDRGSQLLATKGNAAPQVEEVFTRACELSERLGEHHLLFRALYGLMMFCIVRGQLERAHKLGERLVERAELADDRDLLLQAKRPLGLTLCYLGKFGTAKATLKEALRLYDPVRHHHLRFEYGSDPAVLAQCNLAWTEWFLGLADSAVADSGKAIERAVQLDHPHSLGFALSFEAAIRQARGEPIETRDAAERAISVGHTYRFPYWSAWGRMLRGWAIGRLGRLQEGVAEIEQGLADYRATGAELMRPHGLMLFAETVAAAGDPQHALNLLDEAAIIVSTNKTLFYEPELHRFRGEFLLALNRKNPKAVDHFRKAADLARELGAQALELRAVLSLASVTRGAERLTALEKLSNLRNQAVEGFGTSDLTSAARLLNPMRTSADET